mmetsp:Transcript_8612/g.9810  ORF Transcript_8612/g.9810 Transcript_8612/m.9810 type:complete len:116 (-) Transcript_8612:1242-1589(-)
MSTLSSRVFSKALFNGSVPLRKNHKKLVPCTRFLGQQHLSTERPQNFIQLAAAEGVDALVGKYPTSTGFDRCLKSLKIESFDKEKGKVVCSLTVDESLRNAIGTLHGGATCTIVG